MDEQKVSYSSLLVRTLYCNMEGSFYLFTLQGKLSLQSFITPVVIRRYVYYLFSDIFVNYSNFING